jgi:PKD repeat protein
MSSTQTVPHRIRLRGFGPQAVFPQGWAQSILAASTALAVLGSVAAFAATPPHLAVVAATASADDGHVAANAVDGSLSTRWSAQGDGQWLRLDLGSVKPIGAVSVAWYQGNQRRSSFDLQTSSDGESWTTVFSGQSSGTTLALEAYPVTATSGRYLRLVGHGNSTGTWNSVSEVELYSAVASAALPGLRLRVDPASSLIRGTLNGSAVTLHWDRQAGAVYRVRVSTNMVTWTDVGAAFTNNSTAPQSWTESDFVAASGSWPRRFYMVKRAPIQTAPVANFSASQLQGTAPLLVAFTDRSTGNPVSWNWNFGDGASSTAQNPTHTYSIAGSYTATLTIRDGAGSIDSRSASILVTPPVSGGSLPSQVLDLANWKLTLPVDTSHAGSPDEYLQPELNGFQDANYFHINSTQNGVVFTAPCGGATTSGSGYPRSELREMANHGSTTASWSTTSGTHTMEIRQAITHLPVVKPHMVAGQIHNAADDVIVFRLEGSKLFVDQNGVNGPVITTNYQLGTVFTVKFVAHNGGVDCYYNGQFIYTYPVSTSGCYFKAGCYTQSNTSKGDAASAYGEVVIYNVTVTHQ